MTKKKVLSFNHKPPENALFGRLESSHGEQGHGLQLSCIQPSSESVTLLPFTLDLILKI